MMKQWAGSTQISGTNHKAEASVGEGANAHRKCKGERWFCFPLDPVRAIYMQKYACTAFWIRFHS